MRGTSIVGIFSIAMIASVLMPLTVMAQQKSLKDQLVGTWIYASSTAKRDDGSYESRPSLQGAVTYTADGRFHFITTRTDAPKYASGVLARPSPDEAMAIASSALAYTGTYTVDEGTRTIHVTRSLGYVEGQNLAIEHRFAGGRIERLPELARELVQLNMDVIVAVAPNAIRAAKDATTTIRIVMYGGVDPIAAGIVASLARPEGNLTGVLIAPGMTLVGKRLELLKEMVPRAVRIGRRPCSAKKLQRAWPLRPA